MADVTITTVETKTQLNTFIKLVWNIYEGDPNWVPPLLMDIKKQLNKEKNPFFKHADAEYYIAWKDGQPVGRIAAVVNDLHNEIHEEKLGFFGFFESINDQEVANALLQKALEWVEAKGMTAMRGPANFSSNDVYGMLIDGFDDPPNILMPYNPKYYIDLLENAGFIKAKDLHAWDLHYHELLKSEKLKRGQALMRKRYNVRVDKLNLKNIKEELAKIKYVYNKAWEKNWGFVPLTDEEIDAMAEDLKPLAAPEVTLFLYVNDQLVGFALCMPDYNQVFKKMNGRLFPTGIFKLMLGRKKIDRARIIILGLIPEFRGKGLDSILYYEIVHNASDIGIRRGEASWVLEDNVMMRRGLEMMNANPYKTYRLYEKAV